MEAWDVWAEFLLRSLAQSVVLGPVQRLRLNGATNPRFQETHWNKQ